MFMKDSSLKTIIKPKKIISWRDLTELWQYKELLYFFAWRDFKVRYKQTMIGAAWAIFQPVITMVIFTYIFSRYANIPSDGVPYPIFVYIGLIFWQFFSGALTDVSNCLILHQPMVTKVYFPRLVLPISSVIVKFVDFMVASLILIGMLFYYGYHPHIWGLIMILVVILMCLILTTGLGLICSALNVKYRDIRYILPFFIQTFIFVTPVIYPLSIVGKHYWLLALNPMAGVIQTARATILGVNPIDWTLVISSLVISLAILVMGILYFKKTERYLADII